MAAFMSIGILHQFNNIAAGMHNMQISQSVDQNLNQSRYSKIYKLFAQYLGHILIYTFWLIHESPHLKFIYIPTNHCLETN